MSQEIILNAKTREGEIAKGEIPVVVYGPKTENVNLTVNLNEFIKVYEEAKGNNIIELVVDGKTNKKVLVKDVQKDPVKDFFIHVDFYEPDMTKTVEVEVALNFINESKAVKELGGILSIDRDTITLQCLPTDLVNDIDVDLAQLNDFSAKILASDVILPKNTELVLDGGTLIATVIEPKKSKDPKKAQEDSKAEGASAEEAPKAEGENQ